MDEWFYPLLNIASLGVDYLSTRIGSVTSAVSLDPLKHIIAESVDLEALAGVINIGLRSTPGMVS